MKGKYTGPIPKLRPKNLVTQSNHTQSPIIASDETLIRKEAIEDVAEAAKEQADSESIPKQVADNTVPLADVAEADQKVSSPSDVTDVAPVVQASQSVTVNAWTQVSQEHPFDNAEPLDPAGFPNQPPKENSPLPVTIGNILHLLKAYGIQLRYNVIKKKLEVICAKLASTSDNRDTVALTIIRACKNFCVNGHPAGNCHIARSDDDRRKESSTQGVTGQPVG